MVEDFNNVQDQNLVDDDIANQIAGDNKAQAGQVGSVVHPDDPKPSSQKPPTPTAQELLGDKIEQVAAQAKADNPTPPPPQPEKQDEPAQPDKTDEPPVEEPKIEVPEPEIATDEKQEEAQQEDKPEENFIPAPDDTPTADSSDDQPAPDDEDSGGDDDSNDDDDSEDEADEPKEDDKADENKPKLDTSHLEGGTGDDEELAEVKQEALEDLSPLIDHLDLPADQKFDTYMEILRASDDKTLVKPALEAAREIEDDDKRAQALLDVVNEVNYLTSPHDQE